ncbi:hypothetical protein PDESU_05748 [Pontiella desulfatans]|uniref:Novel STAND NTPase 1 domain-containing protein n=1 Tax=Pontiella desulfatans TaxID=2750659 RepID=A0A6C2UBB0_PONDE|nr:hypothetical protein PDESU_05748 [Pontiella desulfatans]
MSSPSDVVEERRVVDTVVAELCERYASWVHIERVLWEKELLCANRGGFQDQIVPIEQTHLVVSILWSKIGYPLGEGKTEDIKPVFHPPTWQGRNPTGTELEIVRALQAYDDTPSSERFPDLLVYRKTGREPLVPIEEAEDASRQLRETRTFFDWLTKNESDGSFSAAFHQFESLNQFEELLKEHLPRWIEDRLGVGREQSKLHLTWPHGSPFRALEPFDVHHHPVFFGRQKETFGILERFRMLDEQGMAFLMVLGMSGSGKSSLIRAGVIARLDARRDERWCYAIMNPGLEANLAGALIEALHNETALPELSGNETLANIAKDSPQSLGLMVEDCLEAKEANLFLFIDQFEELFTGTRNAAERKAFARILLELARSKRVWVCATMRSDFYHRLEALPDLLDASGSDGLFHLQSPSLSAIDLIVRRPALAAGLRYEEIDGVGLDQAMIDDANGLGDCLPLLEFTLHRLYEVGYEDGILAYDEYESIGKIGGAVDQHARSVVASMDKEEQRALPRIFDELVGLDSDGKAVRQYPRRKFFGQDTPADRMIKRLVKERLLIAGEDAEHEPTVALAHDLLLVHWSEVGLHIEQNRERMQQRQWLRESARQWDAEHRNRALLLETDRLVDRAEIQWVYAGGALGDLERAFVEASVKRRGRKSVLGWVAIGTMDIILLVCMGILVAGIVFPSFRDVVVENDSMEIWVDFYATPLAILLAWMPALLFMGWLTWRKVMPVPSVKCVTTDLRVALVGLGLDLAGYATCFTDGTDLSDSLAFGIPVTLLWGLWIGNSLRTKRQIAGWSRKRNPIRRLNVLRVYFKPLLRGMVYAAATVFIIAIIAVAMEETSTEQAQWNLDKVMAESWNYNGGAMLSLVEDGAGVDTRNAYGSSPLHLAALYNDTATAQSLLDLHGADIDAVDKAGNTPLFLALQGSSTAHTNDVVWALLSHGADLEHRNYIGGTPLGFATELGKVDLTELLLRQGAETEVRTHLGATPAYSAAMNGHLHVLSLLWGCTQEEVARSLSASAQKQDGLDFDRLCCAAVWHRWKGALEESRRLYAAALALAETEGNGLEAFVLSEYAQTYFVVDPSAAAGIDLVERACEEESSGLMRENLVGNLLWHYVQGGRFDDANKRAQEMMPTLDESDPSPLWMNCAHALLFTGDKEGAREIYARHWNETFVDGRNWGNEAVSDWSQLEWLEVDTDILHSAKTEWEVHTPDLSFMRKPEGCDTGELKTLRDRMVGRWRCEELFEGRVFILEWTILPDGRCSYNFFRAADRSLHQTSYSTWKIGIHDGMNIWGEQGGIDGAVTLASIQFGADGDELVLTRAETTSQWNNFQQRLYRRIK